MPITNIIQAGPDQKVKSVNYMISVRPKGGGPWKFLDGSGFKENRDLLWVLLPELTKDVELPPQSIETIE